MIDARAQRDAYEAGKQLYELLRPLVPTSNVLIWVEDGQLVLKVWVNENYLPACQAIAPAEFKGYQVSCEIRPEAIAAS